jgi:hypothetical protein
MHLDEVDRELEAAERDAAGQRAPGRRSEEIERVVSASSVSTSSTDSSSATNRRGVGMSRISTQRDLERHPTELGRIHTQRSQHSATVGRSLKSRESKKPLPPFGAGKLYPPPLPDREEYVVEFDGPDDPLHAQNWPLKKKYVTSSVPGEVAWADGCLLRIGFSRLPCLATRPWSLHLGRAFSPRPPAPSAPTSTSHPKSPSSVYLCTFSASQQVRRFGHRCQS